MERWRLDCADALIQAACGRLYRLARKIRGGFPRLRARWKTPMTWCKVP